MPGEPEDALTFDAALLELGVDAKASAEEVRRAYLRLVKSRSPERDPLGFRRARAAYEVVRAGLVMRHQLAANSNAPESAAAPDPTATAANEPTPAPSEDARLEPATAPDKIPNLSPEQQATLALVKRAWEIRETSDWKLMVEAIEAATRWLSGPPVPVPACLYLIVALIAEEQITPALAIRYALGKWFEARQDAARMLNGDLAMRWLLAQELCAVAPEVRQAAAAEIAKALLAGDLTQARSALELDSVVENGARFEVLIERHAPHLMPALPNRTVPPRDRRRKQSGSHVPIWGLGMFLLWGLRALSSMDGCGSSRSTYDYQLPIATEQPAPPNVPPSLLNSDGQFKLARPRLLQSAGDGSGASSLSPPANALARQAAALQLTDLAYAARALEQTRQLHGCAAVPAIVHAMKDAVEHAHDRRLRAAYRDLCAAADRECPAPASKATPTP